MVEFCNKEGHEWHEAMSPMCEECFEKKLKKRTKQLQAENEKLKQSKSDWIKCAKQQGKDLRRRAAESDSACDELQRVLLEKVELQVENTVLRKTIREAYHVNNPETTSEILWKSLKQSNDNSDNSTDSST